MGKKIILTGGGTAGHVTPNIALLPGLRELGYEIRYIGSIDGMEKGLIEAQGIPYDGIHTGKFRRYHGKQTIQNADNLLKGLYEASVQRRDIEKLNRQDLHNVRLGMREAADLIKTYQPDIVFSKGGYVSVPVVVAAHRAGVPVIIHESDMTPGLANRLSFSSATKICCNFPETMSMLPPEKAVLSGSPIRHELLCGSRELGLRFTGLSGKKPVLLMIGGSLGARKLNEVLREALPLLLPEYDIIHLCGRGNLAPEFSDTEGYVQYEYISKELKDLFAASDIVFSRAGANAICELLALQKPNLLVPLTNKVSRGDQIKNARSFEKQGFSKVIEEENLTPETLADGLRDLYEHRKEYSATMDLSTQSSGVEVVLSLIRELAESAPAEKKRTGKITIKHKEKNEEK